MTFARKLCYGAHDGEDQSSFMALIEFALKKGGAPTGFVIYFRIINRSFSSSNRTKMLRLKACTDKEAIQDFWPWGETRGKEFPGFDSDRWEKTTRWLDRVALGYEGMWVRVGTPSPCSARRKRKLQFGNISQILHLKKLWLKGLEEDGRLFELQNELSILEEEDEEGCTYVPEENNRLYAQVSEELDKILAELELAKGDIEITKAEMRYMVRQKFPEPLGKLRKRDRRILGII